MSRAALLLALALLCITRLSFADPLPRIAKVSAQPLLAHVKQLTEALDLLGDPLPEPTKAALAAAAKAGDDAAVAGAVPDALDPLCLAGAQINPESRVKVLPGPAEPNLVEQGWRVFLI